MSLRWLPLLAALGACRAAEPPDTVLVASGAELQSINPLLTTHPFAKQIQRFALFTTLARYDSALLARPYLAKSWTWSADRRTLTLVLQGGVRWHDGAPTTSGDVRFTLEAARDSASGYPRASDLACVRTVEAPDPGTVRLTFCRSQARFPDVLTELAILPAHLLDTVPPSRMATAAFNQRPVGNGPFRFVEHLPGRRWVFEANRDFPAALGGAPHIGRLVVAVVNEPTTKLAALVSGELDLAGIAPMHASVVRKVPGLSVLEYPLLLTYGLVWNTSRPPFDDPRLRRALTLAIDRRQIVAAYLYGFGEIADGPVPPEHPRAVPLPRLAFDRAAAEALLDSLGWRVGSGGARSRGARPLAFTLLTVGTSDNVLEQLIQADLAAVGVRVRVRQMELGAFLAAAQSASRDYDALVTGISGDLDLGTLASQFDSRRRAGPLQYAQYANPAVDAALDRGDLGEVQRIVAREVPITFLYHARGVQGINTRVQEVRMDLRGELTTLGTWQLAPGRRPAAP